MSGEHGDSLSCLELIGAMRMDWRIAVTQMAGAAWALRHGKAAGKEPVLFELIESAAERVSQLADLSTVAYFLGVGAYEPHWRAAEQSTGALAEQMRDEALAARATEWWLGHPDEPAPPADPGFVTVTGEGTEVWVENEIVHGLNAIASELGAKADSPFEIALAGAALEISPVPAGEARHVVTGGAMMDYTIALAVKLIRVRDGTAAINGDTLRIRLPEGKPVSPW